MSNNNIIDLIPNGTLDLVHYEGKELIKRLGIEIISNVVVSVLCGENIRDLTENLTRRRILQMNASLLLTYLKALNNINNFKDNITNIIRNELNKKLTSSEKIYLMWFLGLTGKSVQNVTRDNEGFNKYLDNLDKNLTSISHDIENKYGTIDITIVNDGISYLMNWKSLLRCFLALGAQTLTIRGSEKSAYGKLFEKLILGSLLSLLGFTFIDKHNTTNNNMVFWLSERQDKRESDATVLLRAGYGIRFDIGFIGRGNPEISLDKVSRFERMLERGGIQHNITTIILVDTIGANSRIIEMAKQINGYLVQMSGTHWVKEVACIIRENFNFYNNEILKIKPNKTTKWIKENIRNINLEQFIL